MNRYQMAMTLGRALDVALYTIPNHNIWNWIHQENDIFIGSSGSWRIEKNCLNWDYGMKMLPKYFLGPMDRKEDNVRVSCLSTALSCSLLLKDESECPRAMSWESSQYSTDLSIPSLLWILLALISLDFIMATLTSLGFYLNRYSFFRK